MKKETLITAVVFLGVGFLAGFAYSAHRNSLSRQRLSDETAAAADSTQRASSASSAEPSDPAASADSSLSSQLPKGHPPLTDAEVIQFFKEASAHNSGDPSPRLKLADFLYDRRRFDEAISWYRQALALDPKNVDARTDLATCYFNLGNSREATSQLNEALKVDPRHAPTLFNLAVVSLEGAHDYATAQEALRRLTAINPGYPGLADLERALDQASHALRGHESPR